MYIRKRCRQQAIEAYSLVGAFPKYTWVVIDNKNRVQKDFRTGLRYISVSIHHLHIPTMSPPPTNLVLCCLFYRRHLINEHARMNALSIHRFNFIPWYYAYSFRCVNEMFPNLLNISSSPLCLRGNIYVIRYTLRAQHYKSFLCSEQ